MNKKVFNTILLFTGSVLLAIIILQILWLNNISKIRTAELRSNTQLALTSTVTKLQNREDVSFMMNNFGQFIPDSLDLAPLKDLEDLEDLQVPEGMIELKVTSSDSTIQKMDETQDFETNSNEKTLEQKLIINSVSVSKLNNKMKDIDSLVQQMIFEINTWPIGARVNPDSLEHTLTKELKNRGIEIGYEYAILKGDSIISRSENFIETSALMRFDAKLFPDDVIDKDMSLVVYYPASSTSAFVFSKMKTFLILSGLFTLAILIAFYLTIRSIKRQKKLSDIKNDFINNITHEFKTPIATSSIAIAAMENEQVRKDPERFNYYTGILKEENLKMNEQVEKVLQMAMMEKGDFEISMVKLNVHEILNESIQGFILLLDENKMNVSCELKATNFYVNGDPFHLKNAFNNIIDNSIKYKNESPKLKITTENVNNQLVISFKDNGIGMTGEIQKHAFEKFYRGQKGDLHEVKGFGLGLSYAKSMIERFKGYIALDSSPMRGTEVVIYLPVL